MARAEQPALHLGTLKKFGTDLTKLAEAKKLDPVVGREQEIELVAQILCKRRIVNPCLIGDPGVGKSSVVRGLSHRIINGDVPANLQGKKVFFVDMGKLISGSSNSGEFKKGWLKLVDEVIESEGVVILFINKVHTLFGAAAVGHTMEAAHILKPALADGKLKCIGATTTDEYKKYMEKDAEMKRYFQPVEVLEPTADEAIAILDLCCTKYGMHHNVHYPKEALVAATHLSNRYIWHRFLPEKALDLLDEAGARVSVSQSRGLIGDCIVTVADIQHVVSSWTGIPVEKVFIEKSLWLLNMEEALKRRIVGQNEAVEAIIRAIGRAQVGIRDPNRPIACFLLAGPGGGKNELAYSLASEYYGSKEAVIRLDMRDGMKSVVSKPFGSSYSCSHNEKGCKLTEYIGYKPRSVILIAEFEHAQNDILQAMLQILDGSLSGKNKKAVNLGNSFIIITSNIGDTLGATSLSYDKFKSIVMEHLKYTCQLELLNYIDEVVAFKQLTASQLREMVDIVLKEVCERLKPKDIKLKVTEKMKEFLVTEGYIPKCGVSSLRQAVTRLVEYKLAEKISAEAVREGDSVNMDIDSKGDVVFEGEGSSTVDDEAVGNTESEKFTWKIENFSAIKSKKLYSDVFCSGDYKWQILIFPKGNNVDHLSVYLDVSDSATLSDDWNRYIKFSLAVINQIDSKKTVRKETSHKFCAREADWGFTSFMPLSRLHDSNYGYLVKDTCIIEAEVNVPNPETKTKTDR